MIRLNGVEIKPTVFPDNCSQVWKLDPELLNAKDYWVDWKFSHEGEIMQLAQLADLLPIAKRRYLLIRYLPYGRQDKVISNDTTFGLTTFSKILNQMTFDVVEIIDPHSRIATQLINRSVAIQSTEISRLWNTGDYDVVCYPDMGANSKYSLEYDYPSIYGEKVRDQATGQITNYRLVGDQLVEVFRDGKLLVDQKFSEIRERLKNA